MLSTLLLRNLTFSATHSSDTPPWLASFVVQVMNKRRQRLKCSHYIPILEGKRAGQQTKFPCVIYCHGNCGSRVDASDCLDLLLPQSISVFAFDFSGSGLSDGETISLGFYEQDDLMAVIEYLRASGLVSRIGLWGRSMGAATSVLVAARDPSIAGMVLDSAFSSLTQVSSAAALLRFTLQHAFATAPIPPSLVCVCA